MARYVFVKLLHETLAGIHLVPVDGIEAAKKTHKCRKLPHKMPLYGLESVLSILRWALMLIQVAKTAIYCAKEST